MKRVLLVWFCVNLLVSTIFSQTIVNYFPCPPDGRGWGLEYYDGYLYMGDDGDGFIYKIDPTDGSVVEIISSPYDNNHITYGCNHGVAWDGTGFWIAGDYGKDYLYKIDLTGIVLDSIDIQDITAAVGGLAWNGSYLLLSSYYPNTMGPIYFLDVNSGNVVGQVSTPGNQPMGVGWDGSSIWNSMDDNDGDPEVIYELNPVTGEILSQFDSPAVSPRGIAFGGGYMWLIAGGTYNNNIYQIDLSGAGTPEIYLPLTAHNFGVTAVADTSYWELVVENTGTADLTVDTIFSDQDQFGILDFDLPYTLSPGNSVNITTYFAPSETGYFMGTLNITCNDPITPGVSVSLEGYGVSPTPLIQVASQYHDYGPVWIPGMAMWELEITNYGFQDLIIDSISSANGNGFFVDRIFPISLSSLEATLVSVLFQPEIEGAIFDTLFIYSNDPENSPLPVFVAGSGYRIEDLFGNLLWVAAGIENVEAVAAGGDLNRDGIGEVLFESYDAGASQEADHLYSILGNSSGTGITYWSDRPTGDYTSSGGWGSQCLQSAGDLNGDGVPDLVLGTAWGNRTVFAIDGRDGSVLWYYDSHSYDGEGGWVYSVDTLPDINGDGVPEVLAGIGSNSGGYAGPRSVYCFNGNSGGATLPLWQYQGSDACLSVHYLDDVNSDGVADAVAGFGGNGLDTRVVVVSGASAGSGDLIWSYATGGSVWMVNRINDLDGDGINDVLAGSWDGYVYALSGVNGTLIWRFNVGTYIMRVIPLPDVNYDGRDEVIVASWANSVLVVSGSSGNLLWSYDCGNSVWAVDYSTDLNGDGIADVLAGDFDGDVLALNGSDGSLIWTQNVIAKVLDINWVPDVTGEGGAEVAVGTQFLNNIGGETFLFSGGFSCWDYPGDVNDDGEINVLDITRLVCMILHTCEIEPCAWLNSDFNQDGDVNVMDIVAIVQYILGNPRVFAAGEIPANGEPSVILKGQNSQIRELYLSTAKPIYGFQVDILVGGKYQQPECTLQEVNGWQLYSGTRNGVLTVLGYRESSAPMEFDNQKIASIKGLQSAKIINSMTVVEWEMKNSGRNLRRAHITPDNKDKKILGKAVEPVTLKASLQDDKVMLTWESALSNIDEIRIYRKPGVEDFDLSVEVLNRKLKRFAGGDEVKFISAYRRPEGILQIEDYHLLANVPGDVTSFTDLYRSSCSYRIEVMGKDGSKVLSSPVIVSDSKENKEVDFTCYSYPNPFNSETAIAITLRRESFLSVLIYDIQGRLVRQVMKKQRVKAGDYRLVWDGNDDEGRMVSTGLYFCRVVVGEYSRTIKLVIMK